MTEPGRPPITPVARRIDFADPHDAAAYLALLDAYSHDPMGAGRPLPGPVRARLTDDLARFPTAYGLLAEHDDRPVGVATCFLGYSTFRARPLLNIHDIAVLPAWRGRAIGATMLDAIEGLARELDCCRITLEVREDNPGAMGLYRRHGFIAAACSLFMEKTL